MIALMNLLNRLSESVKLVPEMGPAAEKVVEGQNSSPTAFSRLLEKMQASIL